MSLRPERIADYLKKEISNIILQKVRDPRLKSIVINHISVTQDISVAKVFYSVYKDETELNERILSKFSGFKLICSTSFSLVFRDISQSKSISVLVNWYFPVV